MRAFFLHCKINYMDIVYILGTGSTWQNNEIRYSLRSVSKNISDLGRVFVIGEHPEFLQNIFHISAGDIYGQKWQNAFHKINIACESPLLSDDFLLMNDDFFIFKTIVAAKYPYYFKGEMPNFAVKKQYYKNFKRKSIFDYRVHRPFRYNKKKFLSMIDLDIKWDSVSVRSYYGNCFAVAGQRCQDINFPPSLKEKDFDRILGKRTDMSIFSDTAKNPEFQKWINKKFPEKSIFEV